MGAGAKVTFTITGKGLTEGREYRAAFDWQGKGGQGSEGNTSAQVCPDGGKLTFDLDPIVLVALANVPGPGNLVLSVVNADLSDLGPAYTVTTPIA